MTSKLIDALRESQSLDDEFQVISSLTEALERSCHRQFEDSGSGECRVEVDDCDNDDCLQNPRLITLMSTNHDNLTDFLCYVFERRFGWSEVEQNPSIDVKRRISIVRLTHRKSSLDSDLKSKNQINGVLDDVIKLLMEEKLSLPLLTGFSHAISLVVGKPVVRSRIVIYVMEWMNSRCEKREFMPHLFPIIKDVVVLGLTDVWSVIRNACVLRLGNLMHFMNIKQIEDFFVQMVAICNDPEIGWQAREGAIMGICCVIRKFECIRSMTDEDPFASAKLSEESIFMPESIRSEIEKIIYKLLSNPQLTVRENAIKAYSIYISRSQFKEILISFDCVISQLSQNSSLARPLSNEKDSSCRLNVFSDEFRFLDAYFAEGLLGLCVHLVKRIPSNYFLPNWQTYFSVFNLHMMHPASTVRQATSSIFKFIVAKDSSNSTTLKLVLHNLISDWFPSVKEMSQDHLSGSRQQNFLSSSRVSVTNLASSASKDEADIWQWRESRLLSYELIFHFLIKNHWSYTFGSSYHSNEKSINTHDVEIYNQRSDVVVAKRSLHYSFSDKFSSRLKKQTPGGGGVEIDER